MVPSGTPSFWPRVRRNLPKRVPPSRAMMHTTEDSPPDVEVLMEDVRRVVTGHSPEGKAVFVSDEQVAAAAMGPGSAGGFHQLWGGDKAPTFPADGQSPSQATF